jgi:hypothetical protein
MEVGPLEREEWIYISVDIQIDITHFVCLIWATFPADDSCIYFLERALMVGKMRSGLSLSCKATPPHQRLRGVLFIKLLLLLPFLPGSPHPIFAIPYFRLRC